MRSSAERQTNFLHAFNSEGSIEIEERPYFSAPQVNHRLLRPYTAAHNPNHNVQPEVSSFLVFHSCWSTQHLLNTNPYKQVLPSHYLAEWS